MIDLAGVRQHLETYPDALLPVERGFLEQMLRELTAARATITPTPTPLRFDPVRTPR